MSEETPRPKDSELQAAEGPPDPELDSLIAPQGYSAEEVDDIATMQTPAQQRRSAIRFLVIMIIILINDNHKYFYLTNYRPQCFNLGLKR